MPEIKIRKKKKLGSFPYVTLVFTITVALFVIGLFGLLVLHAKMLSDSVKENIEIQVYLDKNIEESDINRIKMHISSKPYVRSGNNKPLIKFISKDEAAKEFIKDVQFLGFNPLTDAFTVKIDPEYSENESLKKIKAEIQQIKGVYEVDYVESLIDDINKNVKNIGILLVSFTLFLLFAIVVLINNTIKLALFSQRFIIRSMQLVGAKASFIQWPFLRNALTHGLISGLIATSLLYTLLNYANTKIDELSQLQNPSHVLFLMIGIIVTGMLIGFFSTFSAINKYLKLSLDELY
jgi:cell division transport system permease protein